MIAALRKLAARSRLSKARKAYAVALAEHTVACERRDSRRMHEASHALRATCKAVLEAERDALPRPEPLSRQTMRRAG